MKTDPWGSYDDMAVDHPGEQQSQAVPPLQPDPHDLPGAAGIISPSSQQAAPSQRVKGLQPCCYGLITMASQRKRMLV